MDLRFHENPEWGYPHIYDHNVEEYEVEDVLYCPDELGRGNDDNSRVAVGRTRNGRCIKVVFIPDPEPGSVFVVTAYELTGNALSAYRRRNR